MKANPLWARLRKLLPAGELRWEPDVLAAHSTDKWFASHPPGAVAFPRSARSIAKILQFAGRHNIPVTPRGSGYGYVGGCVPVRGGLALSLARMNRILEISREDFVAVVEPGVLTATLQEKVEAQGLFYPPDPASRADCSLGGNVATNAGGPRCLKYGVTRDYVLGLEVVLASGDIVRLGSRTHKNKTGFDLARLFVGTEGLLGVVSEITFKLLPLPPYRACLAVGFPSPAAATRSIRDIFAAGFLPCALEIADEFTLAAAHRRTGSRRLKNCQALIFVEVDGQEKSARHEIAALEKIIARSRPIFIDRALGAVETEKLWQLRREFSFALRDTGLTKMNEDVVVPRGRLEDLFSFAARLQKKHRLPIACFGHAGDGNIHVNIMIDAGSVHERDRCDEALDELFRQVLRWNGVITGEHGIGLAKKPWWKDAVPAEVRALHQTIKRALDPAGILNPGKFLED